MLTLWHVHPTSTPDKVAETITMNCHNNMEVFIIPWKHLNIMEVEIMWWKANIMDNSDIFNLKCFYNLGF